MDKLEQTDSSSHEITSFAQLKTTGQFQSRHLFSDENVFYGEKNSSDSSARERQFIEKLEKKSKVNGSKLSSLFPPDFPKKVDWREKGVISPVINQGKCGACWAISSLETIESIAMINNITQSITQLSTQQLIDCGSNASRSLHGCDGGDVCAVLSWLKNYSIRILTESEYPSQGAFGTCLIPNPDHGLRVRDYMCKSFVGKEEQMIALLALHGPLTAAVDATTWPDYLGGTIKYNCERRKTHAVQIVGYNLEDPVPYYIVKNSWGPEFGLNGYLHIAIGNNLCGIAEDVSSIDVTA